MARSPKLFANLIYDDPNAAADWLCRAFGFELHMAAKDDAGKIQHAELRLGSDLLFIACAKTDDKYGLKPPNAISGQSQSVCAGIDNVDAHYAHAIASGAKILTELCDAPWGARLYTCADPEGHIWTFGDYYGQPISDSR